MFIFAISHDFISVVVQKIYYSEQSRRLNFNSNLVSFRLYLLLQHDYLFLFNILINPNRLYIDIHFYTHTYNNYLFHTCLFLLFIVLK